MDALLVFKDVDFYYQTKEKEIKALSSVSFEIEKEEFASIIGPSGCGKTTILSMIAGLLKANTGKILLNGKKIEKNDSRIGYMFQKDQLFEWRTIWKNITLGIEIKKPKNKDEKYELATRLLKDYDLYAFKDQRPRQLSGGMRQRVALIRTLVLEPELLLLDEPFSALDFQTRLKVCDDVYSMIKAEKKTAILVTHDISEAISMSEKIVVLTKRPASVKNVINLNLTGETPLQKREDPSFSNLFDDIWKKLTDDENKEK